MIPTIKTWRATFPNGAFWLVWAPTKRLAALNLQAEGLYNCLRISRYAAGDSMPVPHSLVQPWHPHK